MDRDQARRLRIVLQQALKQVENGEEVKINVGPITYTDSGFKVQLTGVDSIPGADNFLEAEFLSKCGQYGLKPEHLGQKIKIAGDVHEIIGLKVRNRKYPIITKCLHSGKEYKLTVFTVKNALEDRNPFSKKER